jgi:hypothetical protein
MDAPGELRPLPPALFKNDWAAAPLHRLLIWKTVVVAFWTLVLGWPGRPRTVVGGLLLAAWVLLVASLAAWLTRRFGNPFVQNPLARRLAVRTDHNASGARVMYLLGVMLATLAAIALAALTLHYGTVWLSGAVPAVPAFLDRHLT